MDNITNFTREDIDFDKLHAALRAAHKSKQGQRMTILCCIINHAKGRLHMTKVRGDTMMSLPVRFRDRNGRLVSLGSDTFTEFTLEYQLQAANYRRFDWNTRQYDPPAWEEFRKNAEVTEPTKIKPTVNQTIQR